jgi:type II secretory pathway predicted ATPase ExeA
VNQDILRFFNLSGYPFTKEIATDKLLALPSTQSRLAGLKLLVDTRGIGVLTGKSGTGKSCLLRMLLAELHTGLYKPLYLSHTSVGVQEFYSHLADALGLATTGRRATLYRAIHERVLSHHRQGRIHTVLILDEAHLLSIDVLKELRLLANYEVDSVNAMTILLCGQESLLQKFGLSALEPPANSITVSVSTDGLPQEETFAYIESRITDCGGHAGMFTQGALKLIHQASVGVLRTVGTIATSAMMKAYHANAPTVEAEHVQAVLTR